MLKGLAKIVAVTLALGTSTLAPDAYAGTPSKDPPAEGVRYEVEAHVNTMFNDDMAEGYFGVRAGVDVPVTRGSPFSLYGNVGVLMNYDMCVLDSDLGIKYSPRLWDLPVYFFAGPGLMFGTTNRFILKAGAEALLPLDGTAALLIDVSAGIAVWPEQKPAAYTSLSLGIAWP